MTSASAAEASHLASTPRQHLIVDQCFVVVVSGAPAAEASHPGQEEAGLELQAEVMSVPLRGQGGAATPLTDVGLLFAQNQSKLQALKVSITRTITTLPEHAIQHVCWASYLFVDSLVCTT